METLRLVNHRQRSHQRIKQTAQPSFVGRLQHCTHCVLECQALVEGHHHVGGTVGFPETVNLDQRWVVELRQQLAFVDKAFKPGIEGVAVVLRARKNACATIARSQRRGHIFLQRNLTLKRVVPGQVNNAKSTLAYITNDLKLG